MDVQVRIAKTPKEIDDVFRLRYKIFVEEEGRLSPGKFPAKRIIDRFDTYEHNTNLIVYFHDEPVGTGRITRDGPLGVALDDHYDLSNLRSRCLDSVGQQRPTAVASLLGVVSEVREVPGVVSGLLRALGHHIQVSGFSDTIAIVNPMIAPLLRGLGMERVGMPIPCERVNQKLVAMHGRAQGMPLSSRFLPGGPNSETTAYLREGETIFKTGDPAICAYKIVRGKVDLIVPRNGTRGVLMARLGPGETFGEATVDGTLHHRYTAITRGPCELQVLSDDGLLDYAQEDTEHLRSAVRQLCDRLNRAAHLAGDHTRGQLTGLRLYNDYLIARVINVLDEFGFFNGLEGTGTAHLASTASRLDIPEENLEALLDFLAGVNVIRSTQKGGEKRYHFDPTALNVLRREMGFVKWLVQGYDPVLDAMPELLRGQKTYGKDVTRRDWVMASSSAYISREFTDEHMFEMIPLEGVRSVADIGCGSGLRLIELCKKYDDLIGYGIDLSPECCALARKNVEAAGLSDRITIVQGRAENWLQERREKLGGNHPVDLVLSFAMFHDLMNKPGAAENFIKDLKKGLGPGAYIMIQDQLRLTVPEENHNLSWVRGFELIHHLMGQKLFHREVYEDLFRQMGLRIARRSPTGIPENWIYLLET